MIWKAVLCIGVDLNVGLSENTMKLSVELTFAERKDGVDHPDCTDDLRRFLIVCF